MTTAVDTNILLDILIIDNEFYQRSINNLRNVEEDGKIVVCEIVITELSSAFLRKGQGENELLFFLSDLGIEFVPSDTEVFFKAGRAWNLYTSRRKDSIVCPKCGKTIEVLCPECERRISWRQHIIADFLIGAHASIFADRLLTRDRGCYKSYFSELLLMY